MHILVVGGGMGGTILANNLARRLSGELEQGSSKITMLSVTDKHMYQPGLRYSRKNVNNRTIQRPKKFIRTILIFM